MTDCLDTHRTELVLSTVVSGAFVTMMNGLYTRRPALCVYAICDCNKNVA